MLTTLTINNVDFHLWAAENGIAQTETLRCNRTVVALNGTMYNKSVRKKTITFAAMELRDNTLSTLKEALHASAPARVTYTDDEVGTRTALFYVSDVTDAARVVMGGNTYYSGFGFKLEEK